MCALIDALLIDDDMQRLGAPTSSSPATEDAPSNELEQLQTFPALADLDWAAIEAKQCDPPFQAFPGYNGSLGMAREPVREGSSQPDRL